MVTTAVVKKTELRGRVVFDLKIHSANTSMLAISWHILANLENLNICHTEHLKLVVDCFRKFLNGTVTAPISFCGAFCDGIAYNCTGILGLALLGGFTFVRLSIAPTNKSMMCFWTTFATSQGRLAGLLLVPWTETLRADICRLDYPIHFM